MIKTSKKQRETIDATVVYVGMMSSGKYDEFHTQAVSASTFYHLVLSLLKDKEYPHRDTDRRKWIEVYVGGAQVETIDIEEIQE